MAAKSTKKAGQKDVKKMTVNSGSVSGNNPPKILK